MSANRSLPKRDETVGGASGMRTLNVIAAAANGGVPQARIRRVLADIAESLRPWHAEGIVHGGIAMSTIGLDASGKAHLLTPPASRGANAEDAERIAGYAAFEQYTDDPQTPCGPWTDIYALSAVAHTMLIGQAPPPALQRCVKDVSVPLAGQDIGNYDLEFLQAVDRGLSMRPSARPASLEAFCHAFGLPPLAHAPTAAPAAASVAGEGAAVAAAGAVASGAVASANAAAPVGVSNTVDAAAPAGASRTADAAAPVDASSTADAAAPVDASSTADAAAPVGVPSTADAAAPIDASSTAGAAAPAGMSSTADAAASVDASTSAGPSASAGAAPATNTPHSVAQPPMAGAAASGGAAISREAPPSEQAPASAPAAQVGAAAAATAPAVNAAPASGVTGPAAPPASAPATARSQSGPRVPLLVLLGVLAAVALAVYMWLQPANLLTASNEQPAPAGDAQAPSPAAESPIPTPPALSDLGGSGQSREAPQGASPVTGAGTPDGAAADDATPDQGASSVSADATPDQGDSPASADATQQDSGAPNGLPVEGSGVAHGAIAPHALAGSDDSLTPGDAAGADALSNAGDTTLTPGDGTAATDAGDSVAVAGALPEDASGTAADTASDPAMQGDSAAEQQAEEPPPAANAPVAVRVNVRPWGEVFIDGRSRGISPPVGQVMLPPGRYQVTIRNPASADYQTTITVGPGGSAAISHVFN